MCSRVTKGGTYRRTVYPSANTEVPIGEYCGTNRRNHCRFQADSGRDLVLVYFYILQENVLKVVPRKTGMKFYAFSTDMTMYLALADLLLGYR